MTPTIVTHPSDLRPHTLRPHTRRAQSAGLVSRWPAWHARRIAWMIVAAVAFGAAVQPARADWPLVGWPFSGWSGWSFGCQSCKSCGPCGGAAHQTTPYGDMGCGPKYCGAVHDDPCGVDPCDTCNRWSGCNGARQGADMLAPWQLPPGRGFQNAAQLGYDGSGGGGICTDCRRPSYLLW